MASTGPGRRLLCSQCALPWQSACYRTCVRCRERAGARRLASLRPQGAVVPALPEPTAPPAHPPGLAAVAPSGQRVLCSQCTRPWLPTRYKTCDSCRESARRSRRRRCFRRQHLSLPPTLPENGQRTLPTIRPLPETASSVSWWERLLQARVVPFHQDWSRSCSYCGIILLSTEADGWCCHRGRRLLPRLPPFGPPVQRVFDLHQGRLSAMSRRLNNLFAFSAIGTTGQFVRFQGQANVVLEGRIYHRLLDVADPGHSMHWFLYDETERA